MPKMALFLYNCKNHRVSHSDSQLALFQIQHIILQ